MVPADSHKISRVSRYSGFRYASKHFVYGAFTLFGRTVRYVPLSAFLQYRSPSTPTLPKQYGFGLFPGRSPLLGESLLFSLPAGTKMFQFPAYASTIG